MSKYQLNAQGRKESVTHRKVYRPWGVYQSVVQFIDTF
jgi:hypothetical protein